MTGASSGIGYACSFVDSPHSLQRLAQPQGIAHSALYLASDASRFTTGSSLMVDGGGLGQPSLKIVELHGCRIANAGAA